MAHAWTPESDPNAINQTIERFLSALRPKRLRGMREFAESEIIIPSGPYERFRFKCDRQPFAGIFYDEIDLGRWSHIVATGPSQTGKTMVCSSIPTLYHLFEVVENVIYACPDQTIAKDKWDKDLLPLIQSSDFASELPRSSEFKMKIDFRNGVSLRFMTGGGGDKSRSHYTARVVVATEGDGFDRTGATSRETDKFNQIVARTAAYGSRAMLYEECTLSTEDGRTHSEWKAGTASNIWIRCPHCETHFEPKREHLYGWRDAKTDRQAERESAFGCPLCGELWTHADRRQANLDGLLVHAGQTVEGGRVLGPVPDVKTLGVRWTAAHNLLQRAGDIGLVEWKAANMAPDPDLADRRLRQFYWALPYIPDRTDLSKLDRDKITTRVLELGRGKVPPDAIYLSCAVDIGKYRIWYTVIAFNADGTPHVVDYGQRLVPTDQFGEEDAVLTTLREFAETCENGWEERRPDIVLIDTGYLAHVVYEFVRHADGPYYGAKGYGTDTPHGKTYRKPTKPTKDRPHIGNGWSVAVLHSESIYLIDIDTDMWKSWVHKRLATPLDKPGAMTLYYSDPKRHKQFADHLTAEIQQEEFEPGRGTYIKWIQKRKQNHWFDTTYLASVGGDILGGSYLIHGPPAPAPSGSPLPQGVKRPDGRPYFVTQR